MFCLTLEAPFPGGRQKSSILLKRGHWGELGDIRQKEEGNIVKSLLERKGKRNERQLKQQQCTLFTGLEAGLTQQ